MEDKKLKKVLGSSHVWAIGVGTVIAGYYFGWNYGFESAGSIGMIIAVLVVTVFYSTFVFSFSELAAAIPDAGGPSAYVRRALGPYWGFVTGLAFLFQYVFALPAATVATGAYVNFLIPSIPIMYVAVGLPLLLVLINMFGVKGSARLEIVVAMLALICLVVFIGAGIPHMEVSNIVNEHSFNNGLFGVLGAIPFALWFYLLIEGASMASEELKNPRKDIPKGFTAAILTLVAFAILVPLVTAGIGGATGAPSDYPISQSLALVYGNGTVTTIITIVALSAFISSLNGVVYGYPRLIFSMSRVGYFPEFLSRLNRHGVPYWAAIFPSLIAIILAGSANVAESLIILAVFGATLMYCLTMISVFVLRRKEPNLDRPYKVYYPLVPIIALILAFVLFLSVIQFNVLNSSLDFLGLKIPLLVVILSIYSVATIYYFGWVKRRMQQSLGVPITVESDILIELDGR